jgi:putative endonuclease
MSDQCDQPDGRDHYVYILRCGDDSLYTGYTTDPKRRLAEHNAGEGAKYTRGRTPVDLVYLEAHDTKSDAMSREYEIKQLSRPDKTRLVETSTLSKSDI